MAEWDFLPDLDLVHVHMHAAAAITSTEQRTSSSKYCCKAVSPYPMLGARGFSSRSRVSKLRSKYSHASDGVRKFWYERVESCLEGWMSRIEC
eukprot:353222-Chlamydomonas_euryale.AAC.11